MQTAPTSMYLMSQCKSIKYPTRSAYPQSRDKHACCIHDNCLYMFAGKDGNISLKDFWRFYLGSSKWEKVSFRGDVPQHLEGHTLVSSKKLLLLFGGEFGDAHTESSLWIINPDLNFIRKICLDPGSACPSVRRQHSAVMYHGSMYVYGGYVDVQGSSSQLWRYQIDDEEWELLSQGKQTSQSPGGRYGHSAVIHNKQMWLYGGMTDLQPKQDLWCYTFSSGKWEKLKSKYGPPPLTGHTAVVAGSTMILFGGESSREPVNQLWCFCFKTEKWTQIIPKEVIPSGRTCHSAIFVSPALHQDEGVRASSMPYLQRKLQKMSVGPRPRSSPGYRSSPQVGDTATSIPGYSSSSQDDGTDNSAFERSVSTEEYFQTQTLGPRNQRQKRIEKELNSQNRASAESLKISPSSAENAKEKSPLFPKRTDFNYNISEMLNKNAVVTNGIDNPGISKSTEELINENRQRKLLGNGDGADVMHVSVGNETSNYYDSVSKPELLQRQNTDSLLMGPNDPNVDLTNLLLAQHAKQCRLDPGLVIEDGDHLDGLPNQVEILHPGRYTSRLLRMSSTGAFMTDSDGLETLVLEDYFPKPPSRSVCDSGMPVSRQGDKFVTVRYSGAEEKVYFTDLCENGQTKVSSLLTQPEVKASPAAPVPEEMETKFQPESSIQGDIGKATSRRYTKNPSAKSTKTTVKVEAPYMLILGGKDRDSPPFASRPIPMWKFHFIQAAV